MQDQVPSRKATGAQENAASCAIHPTCNLSIEAAAPLNRIYDLCASKSPDRTYLTDVARFSDRVLIELESRAGAVIAAYADYAQKRLIEPARTMGEYSVELLTLGLALQRYALAAEHTPVWVVEMAQEMLLLRRRSADLKPLADLLRGAIAKWFLQKNIGLPPIEKLTGPDAVPRPSGFRLLDGLPRLISWMVATGEFEQESMRLNNWRSFLGQIPRQEAIQLIETAIQMFDWFRIQAEAILGVYTKGVARFLSNDLAMHSFREDLIFCGKEPAEYHLSMVASEIMNRGLRADFDRTATKVVLVPGCMRGACANHCQAKMFGVDIECSFCTPGCPVNHLTSRMRDLGVKVYIVPHSTGFSRWLMRWQREPDTGVVAAACLMNILPGGYEMRWRGIPSQCVPLNFPGCKKHWSREGCSTTLNEEKLVQLIRPAAHPTNRAQHSNLGQH